MQNSDRFRAPNGKYYTRVLFWDEWILLPNVSKVIKPQFALHRDRPGLINFGRAYIESGDPSGYKVSQELLGDFTFWTVLMSCRWFVAAKEIWDRELDAKMKSEGLEEIRILAKDGMPAQRLAAAKYLANLEYKKTPSTKGRPKREEVDRAAAQMALNERDIMDDLQRIRGVK